MVRLRLRRKGKKAYPVYDIVAVDKRKRRDGAYLERLGYFDPNTSPNTVQIDADSAIEWLNKGAQPSETMKFILSYEGILLKRHLQFKGKTEAEIEEAVEKHKANSSWQMGEKKKIKKRKKISENQSS
jgi:small subunit ribosomal protein S16